MILRVSAQSRTYRWNRDDYYRAVDAGVFDSAKVELIDGEIINMAGQKDEHAFAVSLSDYALKRAFGSGFVVRVQSPMNLGEFSQPEPDLVVVRGSLRKIQKHPTTAALVLEVADTTLAHDREVKGGLYASVGIKEYWIVNLVDRILEVRRKPGPAGGTRFGREYAEIRVLRKHDTVTPLAAPRGRIKVADLLP